MKIIEKIIAKAENNADLRSPVIAFLGDSVTQGCFEIVPKNGGGFGDVQDRGNVYHAQLSKMLSVLYPSVPVNMINAGVAGYNAPHGLERLERDVLVHKPDLTVVCFGLNDCGKGDEGIEIYISSLREIFKKLRDAGSEIIFMTPNMMATNSSPYLDEAFVELTGKMVKWQTSGTLDRYMDAARALCKEENVVVCDCYAKWKKLYENGVDITELLANRINHPVREMHGLFAVSLLETIMEG